MKQSRLMSLVEAVANVAVGYGIAVSTQLAVFPLFGIDVTLAEQARIGAIFTMISIIRSFALRRLFEAIRGGVGCGEKLSNARPAPSLARQSAGRALRESEAHTQRNHRASRALS